MKQTLLVGSIVTLLAAPLSVARAQDEAPAEGESTEAAASENTTATTTSSTTATAETTATTSETVVATAANPARPKLYGFTFGVEVSDESSVNAEPENYNNVLSLGLNVGWAAGKMIFKKGFWAPLSASLGWSLQQEVIGNSDLFRGPGGSADYIAEVPEGYVLAEQGGVLIDPNGVPRRVNGQEKRINYSDVTLGLSHGKLAKLPWKINMSGNMRFILPVSLSSRNASLITAWTTGLGFRKTFLKEDKLSVGYNLGFTKYFHRYTTPGIHYSGTDAEIYGQVISPAEFIEHGGFRNAEFGFRNGISVGYQINEKLSASTSYSLNTTFSYAIDQCDVVLSDGTTYDTCASTSRVGDADSGRGRRDSQVFTIGADYQLKDWVGLSLGLTTGSPVRTADGHGIRQPFFSTTRNGFTSIGLSASFAIDQLM